LACLGGAFKGLEINTCMNRPYCETCGENPAAINYLLAEKIYYRRQCASCLRKIKKEKPVPPSWIRAGYKKKNKCDRCSFLATNIKTQLRVFYVDGNVKNNEWTNLRTICLNCQATINDSKLGWKPADLVADY